MKITRNNKTYELSELELSSAYYEQKNKDDHDWIVSLLEEYDYDIDRVSDETITEIIYLYRKYIENGDALGELEHAAFEYAVSKLDIPERKHGIDEAIATIEKMMNGSRDDVNDYVYGQLSHVLRELRDIKIEEEDE